MSNEFYPKKRNDIEVPEFFHQDLDPDLVSDLADKIIGATNDAQELREADEINNQYHMKRLAEQAEGMSEDEQLMMCRHFDAEILLEALKYHMDYMQGFMKDVLDASKQTIEKMNN